MSEQKQLKIDISAAGTVKVDALNCTGTECVELSQPIEIVLGGAGKRDEKPEYHQPAVSAENAIKQAF